jgi:hypothetical protein
VKHRPFFCSRTDSVPPLLPPKTSVTATGNRLPQNRGQIAPAGAAGATVVSEGGMDSPRPAGRASGLPRPRHADFAYSDKSDRSRVIG